MFKNQFHGLLTSHTKTGLLQNLNLSSEDEKTLISARDELISAIKDGFRWAKQEARRKGQDIQIPMPRFAMQGSRVYKTLNAPAYPPEQQVDIDLGAYLPFSALGNGEKPNEATSFYFEMMISIVGRYIDQRPNNGWSLDTSKDTCIRVQINDKIHIDLPLYAAPEEEMDRIRESADLRKAISNDATFDSTSTDYDFLLESRFIESVDPTVIHLAHKKEGWIPSDALVIRDWVLASCRAHGLGNSVRSVCRYLKAWRDEQWREGDGPSSIFLLAFTIQAYKQVSDKDCDLLGHVIDQLPGAFSKPILVPCPTTEDFDAKEDLRDRIKPEDKELIAIQFYNLSQWYRKARTTESVQEANIILQRLFGLRLPYDTDRISCVPIDGSKAQRAVKQSSPRVEPLIATPSSTSG